MSIGEVAQFYLATNELNSRYNKNYDAYPCLKTEIEKVDIWWDSISKDDRFEVGSVALHYQLMTPASSWDSVSKYCDIPKRKQRMIKHCFDRRNDNWVMFHFKIY